MPSFAAQARRLLIGESREIKTQPVTNVQRFYRLSSKPRLARVNPAAQRRNTFSKAVALRWFSSGEPMEMRTHSGN